MIIQCFVSHNTDLLVRAFTTYVGCPTLARV